MEVIVFEKDAYYKMLSEMMGAIKKTFKEAHQEALKEKSEIDWIDDLEAKELLNIRSKTRMQQLRSNGEIIFTKYGRKIKYSRKSIMAYLNKNVRGFL
jgi:hypothetical protein